MAPCSKTLGSAPPSSKVTVSEWCLGKNLDGKLPASRLPPPPKGSPTLLIPFVFVTYVIGHIVVHTSIMHEILADFWGTSRSFPIAL